MVVGPVRPDEWDRVTLAWRWVHVGASLAVVVALAGAGVWAVLR